MESDATTLHSVVALYDQDVEKFAFESVSISSMNFNQSSLKPLQDSLFFFLVIYAYQKAYTFINRIFSTSLNYISSSAIETYNFHNT